MPIARILTVCLLTASFAAAADEPGAQIKWKKVQLSDKFYSEGATFGDFNHDGNIDVAAGGFWWEGPDFSPEKKHTFAAYPETDPRGYSKNFLMYSHDLKGDGFSDIIVIGFPGEATLWYENPRGKSDGEWTKHVALEHTDNESPMFGDLLANGKPVLICMSEGTIGYAQPDAADPTKPWAWHACSPKQGYQRFTHGIGWGDVNGDGKPDLLVAQGWYEQPKTLGDNAEWKFHPEHFGNGGSQMHVYDVNGDGRNDVVCSVEAHGYGIAWFEQKADGSFEQHNITTNKKEDNAQGIVFSQPHALDLIDVNGDGLLDIVTGKRWWAHGPTGDPEPLSAPVLYWFELTRGADKQVKYIGHLIDDQSGVGTEVMASDIKKDKHPAICVGNKRGVFVFTQDTGK